MGQVRQALGEPTEQDSFSAENQNYFSYTYSTGPEGTISYDFGSNAELGSADDPGGLGPGVDAMPVLSFSVGYPNL